MSVVVSVFGSGRCEPESELYQRALRFGQAVGEAGFDIATGGYGGVMEAVLRGAAPFSVRRIGVVTPALSARTVNTYVDTVVTTRGYLERLQKLIELGSAYVLFPGGTGTLLELCAVWALRERRLLPDKPIICIGQEWRAALQGIVAALPEVQSAQGLVTVVSTPEEALPLLLPLLGGAAG
jgi:hypothetical protein